jgi:hypothetical protein
MGELGEVVGFNLYNATNVAYWRHALQLLQEQEEAFSPAVMLSHSFLQFTAGKKSAVPKEIVALHEAAGIVVPRGKPGYAEPVRYEAGYAPVIPSEHDLQLAGELIPGFIFLLKSMERGIRGDATEMAEQGMGLIALKNEHGHWELETRPLPPPQEPDIYAADIPDAAIWDALKTLPRVDDNYAFHAELLPAPFLDDTGRATYPVMLLCVSQKKDIILQFAQVPAPQWKAFAAGELANLLVRIGKLPKAFAIAEGPLKPILNACGAAISVPVLINEQAGAAAADAFNYISDQMMNIM